MKKKNIQVVYIITKLELGGAQKVCLSLFNGLAQRGCYAHLISGTHGPLTTSVENNAQVYLLASMQREVTIRAIWHEIKNFIQIIKRLRALRKKFPHIMVHTHSTKAGLIGRWAAFFAGIKTRVHTIHGYGFHEHQSGMAWFIIYFLEFITSFITTHFVCVSAQDAKIGIRLFPRFKHKHSIIRAGVDAMQFHPAQLDNAPPQNMLFTFGTIACFKPQKNIIDLLRAFAIVHVQAPHTRLEIIGDGIQRPLLEQWIKQHNLTQVITLHGWQQSVVPFMKRWNAFVLSSLWEGLPCAVIEARLLQLPVICYQVGGISEVITHEENGLLCKAQDITALAANMQRILYEDRLYTKLKTHHDYLVDFDTQHMIDDHVLLYQQLRMNSTKNSFLS